jgi:hypothetical protein
LLEPDMVRKRWRWAAFVLLWTAAPRLRADAEYDQLVREFNAARQKYYQEISASEKGEQRPADPVEQFMPKFRAYAERQAGKAEAIPALAWIVQSVRPTGAESKPTKDVRWALDELMTDAARPEIGKSLQPLRVAVYSWGAEPLVPLFHKIYKQNPDPDTKAAALFREGFAHYSGRDFDADARTAARKKAATIFRAVLKEFPDSDAAKQAGPYIFEAEHLQIGMKAPDFEGENENGDPVKLSDFKGRVVVIDFWGFW